MEHVPSERDELGSQHGSLQWLVYMADLLPYREQLELLMMLREEEGGVSHEMAGIRH